MFNPWQLPCYELNYIFYDEKLESANDMLINPQIITTLTSFITYYTPHHHITTSPH